MLKKCSLICLSLFLLFSSTSCWDQKEIEDEAFILGLAIDKANDEDKIEVTFQIAQPQAFVAAGSSDKPFWNTSESAVDIVTAQLQLTKTMNQRPVLNHCQIILVGEELAKEGLNKDLDYLLRNHDIRHKIHVGIVKGKAKDIFDIEFKTSLLPAFVLSEMMNNSHKHSFEAADYMNIGRLYMAKTNDYDFVLAQFISLDDKVDISGGGVFKDMRLIGWLNGEEMMGIRFLQEDVESGGLALQLPENLGDRALLTVYEAQSSMKPEIIDDRLYVKLELRIEGDMTEIIGGNGEINEIEFLCKLESLYEQDIKDKIQNSFRKMQQEFNSDPFLLKEKLMNYYPKFWKQNHEFWDEIYSSAVLEIEAKVYIRRIGEIKH